MGKNGSVGLVQRHRKQAYAELWVPGERTVTVEVSFTLIRRDVRTLPASIIVLAYQGTESRSVEASSASGLLTPVSSTRVAHVCTTA